MTIAEQAIAIFNTAAEKHGFLPCHTLTDARRKQLDKRLKDLGGMDAFRRALSALPRDNFLMGGVRKRSQAPFRLDIDRLLSTGSGLGDVLARLHDAADDIPNRRKTFEEEVQELAAGEHGQDYLRQHGAEDGMRLIREAVHDSRRNRGLD